MVSDELNVDSSFIIDRMFLPCGRFFSLENKASPTISSCKIIAPFLQRVQDLETCLKGPTISRTVAKDSTLQRVQDLFLGSSYSLVGYLIMRLFRNGTKPSKHRFGPSGRSDVPLCKCHKLKLLGFLCIKGGHIYAHHTMDG